MNIYHYCIEGKVIVYVDKTQRLKPVKDEIKKASGIINWSGIIDQYSYEKLVDILANKHELVRDSVEVLSLSLLGTKM